MSGFRQLGASTTAIEQWYIELTFEILYLQANRRLRNVQAISGAFKTPFGSNCFENP
jgi:hypothetical protein